MILLGHPALLLLLRLKLRGHLRRQARRLRTPKGLVYMVLGLLMTLGWLAAIFFAPARGQQLDRGLAQLVCALFSVVTIAGAFSHRGLHMPKQELEPLFSSPVRRTDLVRYRLLSAVGPSLVGGLVLGAVLARNLPHPWLGFAGVYVGMLTLPLIGQGFSLLAGSAELRLDSGPARSVLRAVQIVGLLALALGAGALVSGGSFGGLQLPKSSDLQGLLSHPAVALLTAPMRPYAELIIAPDVGHFLRWLCVCLALWIALFECIARLPVDFRELSLATAADMARRIRRMGLGAGASASEVSGATAGWRAPWLFGRGPFGAVAWRKSCSILRKARGTLLTSTLILTLLAVMSVAMAAPSQRRPEGLVGSLILAIFGTIYLCAGLRFDFREDLDAMEGLKTWPLAPWRLFLATILPEVLLVVLLLTAAILGRAAVTGQFHPSLLGVLAGLPFLVLIWVAIDNAAFLYSPVRFIPGQDGALHHAGRAMTMMMVRLGALVALLVPILIVVVLAALAADHDIGSPRLFGALAIAVGVLTLLVEILLLLWIGGRIFQRFDVARDRA